MYPSTLTKNPHLLSALLLQFNHIEEFSYDLYDSFLIVWSLLSWFPLWIALTVLLFPPQNRNWNQVPPSLFGLQRMFAVDHMICWVWYDCLTIHCLLPLSNPCCHNSHSLVCNVNRALSDGVRRGEKGVRRERKRGESIFIWWENSGQSFHLENI